MRTVLLVVDNSNVHVHMYKTYGPDARFSYLTFEKLFYGNDKIVSKHMIGSSPPYIYGFWNYMRQNGYEVSVYERKRDKNGRSYEKAVDTAIVAKAVEAIINHRPDEMVLLSGDLDMSPLVEMAKRYSCYVTMWAFYQSSSSQLEKDCDEVYFIDDYLDELIYFQDRGGAVETYGQRQSRLERESIMAVERDDMTEPIIEPIIPIPPSGVLPRPRPRPRSRLVGRVEKRRKGVPSWLKAAVGVAVAAAGVYAGIRLAQDVESPVRKKVVSLISGIWNDKNAK